MRKSKTRRIILGFAAAAIIAACGGNAITGKPVTGGESHFLRRCVETCGGGLDCISGICTRSCLLQEPQSCGDLAASATCTNQSIEPGNVAVCDLSCESDADCASLGPSHRCEQGFCRAPAAVGSGSGGSGGGSSGSGGSGGSDGAACEVLHQTYPSGSSDVPNPRGGCSPCGCEDGELVCIELACTGPMPIFPCPDNVVSDPVEVDKSRFEGDTLVLDVHYGGGCADHDFGVCYQPGFDEPVPVQTRLELIHDARGDSCAEDVAETLRFDMTPLARFYDDSYPNTTGAIRLNFGGIYAFGELSCEARSSAAAEQTTHAASQLELGCTSASDCEWASLDVSCQTGCGTLSSRGDRAWLEAALAGIDTNICGQYGCPAPEIEPCIPPPELDCVQGKCVEVGQ